MPNPLYIRRIISRTGGDALLSNPVANHFYYNALLGNGWTSSSANTYYGITDDAFKIAINTLFDSLSGAGILSKIKRFTPRLGDTSALHGINAVNPGTYTGSFTGGVTYATDGTLYNGTTGYETWTGFYQNTLTAADNWSYSFTNVTSGGDGDYIMGVHESGGLLSIFTAFGTDYFYNNSTATWVYRQPRSDGDFITTTSRSTGHELVVDAGSTDTSASAVTGLGTTRLLVTGALNNDGVIQDFANCKLRNEIMSDALSLVESQNLYIIINAFDATLGR